MDNNRIDQIIDKHQGEVGSLIQLLLDIQHENGWLPKEALERVSEKLQVPFARVQHRDQARRNRLRCKVQLEDS
jgi:NADH-quinone oxidoreductase subunit E